MPYGNLAEQAVQRFERYEDLEAADATIEEREEYEPHLADGNLVFAGIDYASILERAEQEADVILWDGGNNDTPFVRPDVHIVVLDPHRPGHELLYHPGETNLRMADVCVVNKIDSASQEGIDLVLNSIHEHTTNAEVVLAASPFHVEGDANEIRGKRVLAIEDGPTLTHGEMSYGAAVLAAKQHGAAELVDPRPFAVGSIAKTFEEYPHVGPLLPAMGYGNGQVDDLRETIDPLERRPRPDRDADRPSPARRLRAARNARDVPPSGSGRTHARERARREGAARADSARVTTVVALGGNALVREGERGTTAEQRANLRTHVGAMRPLLEEPLVLTHGNGPRSGRVCSARNVRPARPRPSHSGSPSRRRRRRSAPSSASSSAR